MEAAIASVRAGNSIGKAAKENGVPKSSLHDKIKGKFSLIIYLIDCFSSLMHEMF